MLEESFFEEMHCVYYIWDYYDYKSDYALLSLFSVAFP